MTDHERRRNIALTKVWKIITTAAHYSVSQTGPHLTLTKRLDVLRRALEAAYDAGARSANGDRPIVGSIRNRSKEW